MKEDEPLIIPPEEPEPNEASGVAGDALEEPTVPLAGEFEVTEVTRFPEDLSERDRIRQEYDGPSASIDVKHASIDRPAVNPGRKGRGNINKKNQD
jgi:hypothetical protein